MKILSTAIFLLVSLHSSFAQTIEVEQKFNLPSSLIESSGLIFFNGKLVTHNDSGGMNVLYELDTLSGEVTRTITISNASHKDWEDITQDENYIYVGDFGNNNGNRTDLKIYKINKNEYLESNTVNAEIISFSYADQSDFSEQRRSSEFDCEALISIGDKLILISKNWVDGNSKAYSLSKNPGEYEIQSMPTILNSGGLITGATFNQNSGKIYISGYSVLLQPFLWICESFDTKDIFSGLNTPIPLSDLGFEQIEAISHFGPNRYFMSAESLDFNDINKDAKLLAFSTNDAILSITDVDINNFDLLIDSIGSEISIKGTNIHSIEIYDSSSSLIHSGSNLSINISDFNTGVYFVKINLLSGSYIVKKFIKSN